MHSDRAINCPHPTRCYGTNPRQAEAIYKACFPKTSDFAVSSSASSFFCWYYQEVALSEHQQKITDLPLNTSPTHSQS